MRSSLLFRWHHFYRPCSEASEGYVFTGECHSFCPTSGGGEGVDNTYLPLARVKGHPHPPARVKGQPPPPPRQHHPPHWTTPPPLARVKCHLPAPGQGQRSTTSPLDNTSHSLDNTSPWPGSKVNHLPPGQHLALPGQHLPLARVKGRPPPPNLRALCIGGRYASYWNAFLFNDSSLSITVQSGIRNRDRVTRPYNKQHECHDIVCRFFFHSIFMST